MLFLLQLTLLNFSEKSAYKTSHSIPQRLGTRVSTPHPKSWELGWDSLQSPEHWQDCPSSGDLTYCTDLYRICTYIDIYWHDVSISSYMFKNVLHLAVSRKNASMLSTMTCHQSHLWRHDSHGMLSRVPSATQCKRVRPPDHCLAQVLPLEEVLRSRYLHLANSKQEQNMDNIEKQRI